MSTPATIIRNIASNWVGFAVNAIVTLLLTPFVLHQLAEARYGIWVLASSVVGYYGLLDLGLRGGINQYLTLYLSKNLYDKASECISTAVVVFGILSVVLLVLSLGTAYIAPYIFSIHEDVESEIFWTILIVGITSSIQCIFFPYMAIFMAKQRFDLANVIGVASRLLMAFLVYISLKMGYGLIGISVATCGASLVDYILRWQVACYLVPELRVSFKLASQSSFRETISFGIWSFLISLTAFFSLHAQTLIIGFFMPVAAVGYYSLAAGLSRQINEILTPIGSVMYPVAVGLYAKNETDKLKYLYHNGSRIMLLVTVILISIAAFWAEDFFRLWIGEKYITSDIYPSVALLLRIMLIITLAMYSSNIARQILMGVEKVHYVALLLMSGSLLGLVMSLVFIRPYGLIGVAVSIAISSFIINLVLTPFVLQCMLGFRVSKFLKEACLRPLVAGIVLAFIMWSIKKILGNASDWFDLIFQGAAAGICAVGVVYIIGINKAERQRFLIKPIKKFMINFKSNLPKFR